MNTIIEHCYDFDKLEQLEVLDISECSMGSYFELEKMFEEISTAKGLMHLGLAKIEMLKNFKIIEVNFDYY